MFKPSPRILMRQLEMRSRWRPERHILVEAKSSWFTITDALPQFDRAAIDAFRNDMSSRQ
jgi:hypothetical protein